MIQVFDKVIAMASLEESRMRGTNSEVLAKPLLVEGINDNDLEGHVPREILQRGLELLSRIGLNRNPMMSSGSVGFKMG